MKKIILLAAAITFTAAMTASAGDAKENWDKSCAKCHGADGKGPLDPYAVAYIYDRQNASTPLPAKIDAGNATSVARFAIPSTTWAAWADQTPGQDLQDR